MVYVAPNVINGNPYDASLWQAALDEIEALSAAVNTVWTPYTPVWTAAGSAPVLGNGTLTGLWRRTGDAVDALIRLVYGSTTTGGTGAWKFSMPVTANATSYVAAAGAADCIQTGTTERAATVRFFDSDPLRILVVTAAGFATATVPHTWATTHELRMAIRYPL